MKKWCILPTLIAVLLLVLATDTTAAQTVENPDKPLKGTLEFKYEKLWETDSFGPHIMAVISGFEVDDNETIYVSDRKSSRIHILDKNGKWLSAFGKKGEGPGECKRLGSLFLKGDSLIIEDSPKLHYFSKQGQYRHSVIFPRDIQPRQLVDEHTIISLPWINFRDPKCEAEVSIYNLKEKKKTPLFKFSTYRKGVVRKVSGKNRMSYSFSSSYITPVMILSYHNGKLYYGMSNQYHIHVADMQGKELAAFSLQREPQKAPLSFKKKLIEQLTFPEHAKKEILKGFPDYFNYFQNIKIHDNGNIYVSVNEPLQEERESFDIFSPEGKYLYRARMTVPANEDGALSRFRFKNDKLYMVLENEDGDLKIIKYRVRHPG
ncbi:MAG: 6-bladed beta-propeller [bacterium]|nr:6-bladed beta-propeller [bacterium]